MARILIAWELGEAFGHVARCLQLADGLRQRGHSVVMTLKDLRLPAGSALPPGITLLPTPLTPRQRPPGQRMPINYADVLRHCGFAAVEDVTARLLAWHGIFSLARPAVLVADHAPTALLAARLAGIPALAIGNGFAIPPDIRPWPSIRPWETIPEEALVAAEQRLDGVTEAARKALGHGPAVRVRELFGAHDVLDTFAELDHYGARQTLRYVGPIVALPQARTVSWQTTGRAKLLAYLRPEAPGFTAILRALAQVEAEVLCIAPGLAPDTAQSLATRRLRIALAPVDLAPLLAQTDLAVGYGSSGFVTQALLSGVPLLLRPRHVEHALLARRIEALGAGGALAAGSDATAIAASLREMLNSPQRRDAAQAFSDRYRQFSPQQAILRTLALIEQALAAGSLAKLAGPGEQPREIPPTCLH